MGWLIDKIRSWFCKHEWECLVDRGAVYNRANQKYPSYYQWLYVCKKCGKKRRITSE